MGQLTVIQWNEGLQGFYNHLFPFIFIQGAKSGITVGGFGLQVEQRGNSPCEINADKLVAPKGFSLNTGGFQR